MRPLLGRFPSSNVASVISQGFSLTVKGAAYNGSFRKVSINIAQILPILVRFDSSVFVLCFYEVFFPSLSSTPNYEPRHACSFLGLTPCYKCRIQRM